MSLLEKYLERDEEIKALTAQKAAVRAEIGELSLGSTPINDDFRLSVSETRKFSPALAKKVLSEEEYNESLKTSLDLTLVKRNVSPKVLETLYEVSGQTWKIVARDD